MGWHINLVKNEVKINESIIMDLRFESGLADEYGWEEDDDVFTFHKIDDIRLNFNPDHMEHMDFVWQIEVQDILKKHKVEGDICFSSDDGDNKGQAWGYRFDGKGGMVHLTGQRTFTPVEPASSTRSALAKAPKKSKARKGVTTKKTRKAPKKTRRASKKSPRSKVVWTKPKGKLKLVCGPCYEDTSLPAIDQFGLPRGTDLRKEHRTPRYCGTCGEEHGLKKIRV